jgi:hypothetical protein
MRWTLLLAVLGGSALAASPASAASFSIGVSFPGVGFSYNSGGYCDDWGCPGAFWNYPVYYCPVYYRNRWYRGPVYYRYSRGDYLFWVHGGWRRDAWSGPRPRGACVGRYGPPLDLDFYIWNGFRIRDDWRYSWYRERNDWWRHRQQWDRSFNNDTRWRSWLPAQQQSYDWNRERNWNGQRDWVRRDWNRADWERRNGIDRNRGGQPGINPPTNVNPERPVSPPVRIAPVRTPPAANNPPRDNRDRFRGGRDRGGAMSPTVEPTNNQPADNGGRNRDRNKGGRDRGAMAPPSPAAPEAMRPANNPPSGNRDRSRGGRDQGGSAAPAAAPANSPSNGQNGDERRNKKDRKGSRDNP